MARSLAFLSRILRASSRPTSRASVRPEVETLAARIVPALSVSLNGAGRLMIHGTKNADNAIVEIAGIRVQVQLNNKFVYFSQRLVKSIEFHGLAGNDLFRNDTSIPSEAHGGLGDDQLLGGTADDKLYGDGGNDWIDGRAGADKMWGGAGHDTFHADGNDKVFDEEWGRNGGAGLAQLLLDHQ